MTFLTIFWRFMTSFQRFPVILQKLSEAHTYIFEHFSKIFKDYQRFPKTEDTWQMWRCSEYTPTNITTIINNYNCTITIKLCRINISTSKDMENMPSKSQMWFCINFMSGVFSCKIQCAVPHLWACSLWLWSCFDIREDFSLVVFFQSN